MIRRLACLLPALVLTACFEKAEEDEDEDTTADSGAWDDGGWTGEDDTAWPDEPDEPGTIDTAVPELGIDCGWDGPDALWVFIEGGAGPFRLGLRETPESPDPWTGEDCAGGYVGPDGSDYRYCHPMSPDGGTLINVSSVDEIVEGETTLFWRDLDITYMLRSVELDACWSWGADPAFYLDSMGCSVISLECR
ncbi:MAG: hypothetical protein H6742_20690 [Alphaproteobacteria bacterium]|nr:hypothetical protein [Alphaproteobacteria bacterium]